MQPTEPQRPRARLWCALAALLLVWNASLALYANPYIMVQQYDGTQYQLLVRNRLHGHHEVGDSAHTVRDEGRHPIWRPGLVWVEEFLARPLGSVRLAAGLASALGTTLLEIALLWLAWRCFGRGATLLLLVALLLPNKVAVLFLVMALGQGPEPWSAAALLWGLACLVEALRRRSWGWAVLAGGVAGSAEWFRTGNYLLFMVPCLVWALAALRPWDRRAVALPLAALLAFVGTVAATGAALPSPVNKTVVNLWHRMVENGGEHVPHDFEDVGVIEMTPGGLALAPGSDEAYYDYIVREARTLSTRDFLRAHGTDVLAVYWDGLRKVITEGARGLRFLIGELALALLLAGVVVSLGRRHPGDVAALAFAAGGLAHYLGPVALLRADDPNHYVYVAIPLMLLTAAHGASRCAALGWEALSGRLPRLAGLLLRARRLTLPAVAPALLILAILFFAGSHREVRKIHREAAEQQAALDALGLEGHTVVCRNMSWFVDRDVRTVLLPYATAPQLERYALRQGSDGVLLWEGEKQVILRLSPYGEETEDLERALANSTVLGPPRASGDWRWYPVRGGVRASLDHP
jgi:hypothetical protein